MTPFRTLTAIAAPFPQANIDTDVIMPKQFLKRIDRAGLAEGVFHDLRLTEGVVNPGFILNQAPYDAAEILVCGDNFGCGSSREYAVWGLMQFGVKVIIAPSFAGIFFGNCEKNGLLAITLPEATVAHLLSVVQTPSTACLEIDLPHQKIRDVAGNTVTFEIGISRKDALLSGADHIETTLSDEADISKFEGLQKLAKPWLWLPKKNHAGGVADAHRH